MMWDSFQNLALMEKALPFIDFGPLACVCMPVYAYACMKHAYTALEHACAYACMRMHALGLPGLKFLKIDLFCS